MEHHGKDCVIELPSSDPLWTSRARIVFHQYRDRAKKPETYKHHEKVIPILYEGRVNVRDECHVSELHNLPFFGSFGAFLVGRRPEVFAF